MDNKRFNNIFKIVVICVGIVFLSSKAFSLINYAKETYISQEKNNKGVDVSYVKAENRKYDQVDNVKVVDGVQVIEFDLEANRFPHINVKTNQPVRLIINATKENINDCNYVITSADIDFEKKLEVGENILEFTPKTSGQYTYSCWMGMIGAYINVSDDVISPSVTYGENISLGNCCSFK